MREGGGGSLDQLNPDIATEVWLNLKIRVKQLSNNVGRIALRQN